MRGVPSGRDAFVFRIAPNASSTRVRPSHRARQRKHHTIVMSEIIGRRCEVEFAGDGVLWYPGTIKLFDSMTGCHLVDFDDGDTKHIHVQAHLDANILRWIDQAAPAALPRLVGMDLLSHRCELWFSQAHPKPGWFAGSIDDYDCDTSSIEKVARGAPWRVIFFHPGCRAGL